jgi:hypothetical protein
VGDVLRKRVVVQSKCYDVVCDVVWWCGVVCPGAKEACLILPTMIRSL